MKYRFAEEQTVLNLEVIHYGAKKYDPKILHVPVNQYHVKPIGGLWTSPVKSDWGWKDWCHVEDFRKCNARNSFTLKFNKDAKILMIESYEDLETLPLFENKDLPSFFKLFDYEEIFKSCDAIWLTVDGQNKTRLSRPLNLYGWDCESILIGNPDCCYQPINSKTVQARPVPKK